MHCWHTLLNWLMQLNLPLYSLTDRRRSVVSGHRTKTQRVLRERNSPCFLQRSGRVTRRRGPEQNEPRTGPSLALSLEHLSGWWDQHTLTVFACRWGEVMVYVYMVFGFFWVFLIECFCGQVIWENSAFTDMILTSAHCHLPENDDFVFYCFF